MTGQQGGDRETHLMEGTDGHEPSILSRSSRVGLEGHCVKPSDSAELRRHIVEHLVVSLGLVNWSKRVDVGKLGPGDGDHLSSGVELHCARPEGDHRVGEGQVLVLQALEVPQHRVLVVVRVENRVLEEGGGTGERSYTALNTGGQAGSREGSRLASIESLEEAIHVLELGGLVKGDSNSL